MCRKKFLKSLFLNKTRKWLKKKTYRTSRKFSSPSSVVVIYGIYIFKYFHPVYFYILAAIFIKPCVKLVLYKNKSKKKERKKKSSYSFSVKLRIFKSFKIAPKISVSTGNSENKEWICTLLKKKKSKERKNDQNSYLKYICIQLLRTHGWM